ncbi:MAG: hypothetical protein LWX55_11180 [Deltaproteobacteria bacterium]|jgi:hypothetical protein|nr:hypothetical protein [Deltaproteobacteria bacterium]
MTLFTRDLCSACQEVKQEFDLQGMGIKLEELGPDNPTALAHLAWHELVETVETEGLPILVLDDASAITGTDRIKQCLNDIDNG